MENIKDFLLFDVSEETAKKEEKKPPKRKLADYETVFVSGPDFGIRRKTRNTSKVFVCIVSANQIYFKDEKSGEIDKEFSVTSLNKFLTDLTEDGFDFGDECPCWINKLYKGTKFATNFVNTVSNDTTRHFISKNMIFVPDMNEFMETVKSYYYTGDKIDISCAELVFRILSEVVDINFVKECFALSFNNKYANCHRVSDNMLPILDILEMCYSTTVYTHSGTAKEIFFGNFFKDLYGIDGLRKFIHSFVESPTEHFVNICELHNILSGKLDNRTYNGATSRDVKFELNKLIEYLFYEAYRQGFDVSRSYSYNNFLTTWKDDLSMQFIVYGEIKNKYPDYLLSHHQLLSTKANAITQRIDKEKWENQVEKMKAFEYENSEYRIVCPKQTNDMVEEARMQSNCLSSYLLKTLSESPLNYRL